jgi:hypothetical protein
MNQQYNPQYVPPPVGPRNSTTAIISLISGIAGWTILPLIGSIVAVITGHMAKNEIKKSAGMVAGNGMATAGLILGYVALALGLCAACVFALSFAGLITLPFVIPTTNSVY